jgi:transposase-like protein
MWFLAMYLYFVLWPGCSIREISLEVVVPYPRCYRFIRTVMEKISSSFSSYTKLGGKVEGDEFYIKAGMKGRPYHYEIIKSGRNPRKRGLKPPRGRGTFDKDHPMVTCIHQRNGPTYFDIPVQQSLLDIVCSRVEYGSIIFTEEYRTYDRLEEHGFIDESVIHSQKEYANGTIHVNNCECRSNLYQLWIRKFMGVNKYNLQTYSKTFQLFIIIEQRHERKDSWKFFVISS